MSQVDEEEEFFTDTFLESLPDGAIYLDGRDRMEKEIDVSLYPVLLGGPYPSKFAYSLRDNPRRKQEKEVVLEFQNDYFLRSEAARCLSSQGFHLRRPFWEFIYKTSDGKTVEEQVCRVQVGEVERLYYSHRVLPDGMRSLKVKEYDAGVDLGENYDINTIR